MNASPGDDRYLSDAEHITKNKHVVETYYRTIDTGLVVVRVSQESHDAPAVAAGGRTRLVPPRSAGAGSAAVVATAVVGVVAVDGRWYTMVLLSASFAVAVTRGSIRVLVHTTLLSLVGLFGFFGWGVGLWLWL
jgi:predicted phage tail protein